MMTRTTAALVFGLVCMAQPVWGASRARAPEPPEGLIQREVDRAKSVLNNDDPAQILDAPYLVSALYYSDQYFTKLRHPKTKPSPQDKIILGIRPLLAARMQDRYLAMLQILGAFDPDEADSGETVAPLRDYELRRCGRRCHDDALDLFADEGAQVRSITRGVVVLAIDGWEKDRPYTTVSHKGGNEVIIFNPDTNRFYRYCHLSAVTVRVRELIPAGLVIGKVGHSGANASRRGHGQHLHLEINQYNPATHSCTSMSRTELTTFLKNLKTI